MTKTRQGKKRQEKTRQVGKQDKLESTIAGKRLVYLQETRIDKTRQAGKQEND
jgi:hypothetical protein